MDGGMDYSAQSILENKAVVVFYFALLLLLVVMVVFYMRNMMAAKSEHYYGYGMPDSYQVLASGPDVRFQEFTGTNQGNTPVNMATVKQMYPGIAGGATERLTASRDGPDYLHDISQTLAEYQFASQFSCSDGSAPMPFSTPQGMTYMCGNGSAPTKGGQTGLDSGVERATASPSTLVQESLLMNQLGY